jgi:hypothetical protein
MKKQTNMINEHDQTKKMLDVLRRLNENNEAGQPDEGNDVISLPPNDPTYIEEFKKISDTIDTGVKVTKFKIYPKAHDVQFEGRFNCGINFFMSTKVEKLAISILDENGQPMRMFVDGKSKNILEKLPGFYENWLNEWNNKLNTEYKPK